MLCREDPVGAISATCQLSCIASAAATAATAAVFPDPTSPWSRRCIGSGWAMSLPISATASCLRPGQGEGRSAQAAASRSPSTKAIPGSLFTPLAPE